MGKRCCTEKNWKKRSCGILLIVMGIGMLFSILLQSFAFLVALALICLGAWLLQISGGM